MLFRSTGVTVPEWTAVMMLTGSASTAAPGYMQTIFRVQSAGVLDGKQKERCYVFDFAPDRAQNVLSEVNREMCIRDRDLLYQLSFILCQLIVVDSDCLQCRSNLLFIRRPFMFLCILQFLCLLYTSRCV